MARLRHTTNAQRVFMGKPKGKTSNTYTQKGEELRNDFTETMRGCGLDKTGSE